MQAISALRGHGPDRLICAAMIAGGVLYAVFHIYGLVANLPFGNAEVDPDNLSDFFVFYSAAKYVWEGGSIISLYDFGALKDFQMTLGAAPQGLHPFNYPPTYLLVVLPCALLPYAWAFVAWSALTLAALLLAARSVGFNRWENLALFAAPASLVNFSAGQNGFLFSAALVAGLFLATRKPNWSGFLFGALTIKPHLGLLIPAALLARGHWRVIAAAVLTAATLVAVSVAFFGVESWSAYAEFSETFRRILQEQNVGEFVSLSSTIFVALRSLELALPAAYAVQLLVSLSILATTYWAYRTCRDDHLPHIILLLGAMLASPFGFLYDLPFLSVAIIMIVRRGLREGFMPLERPVLAAAWLLPFVGSPLNDAGLPLAPIVFVVLFGFTIARARMPLSAAPVAS